VKDVTGSLRRLGGQIDQSDILFQDNGTTQHIRAKAMYVDYNYIPFYQIKLLAGRNISPQYGSDAMGNSYLVNESMSKTLLELSGHPQAPLNSLIGKPFRYNFQDKFGTIVGITNDFNFSSLHEKVEPLCITFEFDYYFKEISIRIDGQRNAETLALIEKKWKSMLPDQQFEYHFLDNYINQLYQADTQTGQLIAGLTLLALLISGLGLIGLTTYNTERRTKEIGIRKVLGASVQNIVTMLSRDFLKLVIIGIAIGIPLAWYTVGKWLEGFAYRIEMSWWMFFACALAAIFLALATVSYQSIRTALINPVDSLRSE
jgi:putative ABC transport system permease protein